MSDLVLNLRDLEERLKVAQNQLWENLSLQSQFQGDETLIKAQAELTELIIELQQQLSVKKDLLPTAGVAVVQCLVPDFEVDALWNPSGDFFTVRPLELLRKLFDELACMLRWRVADALCKPGSKLYFSAMQYSDNGQASLVGVAITKRGQSIRDQQLGDRLRPADTINTIGEFLQLACSYDCDKLLQHIADSSRWDTNYHANKGQAAETLFRLRNAVFHRGMLAYGSDELVLQNSKLALKLFAVCAGKLTVPCRTMDECFIGPFSDHARQLKSLMQLAVRAVDTPLWTTRPSQRQAQQPSSLVDSSRIIDSAIQKDEELCLDIALLLLPRFDVRSSHPAATTDAGSSSTGATRSTKGKNRLSVNMTDDMKRLSIKRWAWNPAGHVEITSFSNSDPLGVTNADLLFRATDAFVWLVNGALNKLWRNSQPDRTDMLSSDNGGEYRVPRFQWIELSSSGNAKLMVQSLSKDRADCMDVENPDEATMPLLFDPLQLTHLLGHRLGAGSPHRADLSWLYQLFVRLSHQYYLRDSEKLDLPLVTDAINRMLAVVNKPDGLADLSPDRSVSEHLAYSVLLELQDSTSALRGATPKSNYRRFRDRQVGMFDSFKQNAAATAGCANLERLQSLLTALPQFSSNDHVARVARALFGRCLWTQTESNWEIGNIYAALTPDDGDDGTDELDLDDADDSVETTREQEAELSKITARQKHEIDELQTQLQEPEDSQPTSSQTSETGEDYESASSGAEEDEESSFSESHEDDIPADDAEVPGSKEASMATVPVNDSTSIGIVLPKPSHAIIVAMIASVTFVVGMWFQRVILEG